MRKAVVVRELHGELPRAVFEVIDGLMIGNTAHHVDVGSLGRCVAIWWQQDAWMVGPSAIPTDVDGKRLREPRLLHHGTEIAEPSPGGWRVRFLFGERERALDELRHVETQVDRLTGLLQRSVAYRRLARMTGGSVMMIDVDRMKQINDVFGIAIGDRTLIRTAALLDRYVVWPDLATRYGGEEFLVVLPTTELVGARALAERIRAALAPSFSCEGETVTATVSIGLAPYAGNDTVTLRAVDEALGRAKRAGRNQVSI